ncbi:hypothetical protein KR084_011865, partial [Drosophila pseudotakahashii]
CGQNNVFHPLLPTAKCQKVFKPSVELVSDRSCPSPNTMYRVGFKYQNNFMEVYRSCYDSVNLAAQFSIHSVYRWTSSSKRFPKAFTTDEAMTGMQAAAYQHKRIYDRFQDIFDNNQNYVPAPQSGKGKHDQAPTINPFHIGHLAPSGDFCFNQIQQSTNKLRNAVPQYGNINNGNWKRVEFWVKRLLTSHNYDVLKVCTGALGVHKLANGSGILKSVSLLADNKIPIPKWMYKIVSHTSGEQWVVITYNDGITVRKPNPNTICQEVRCDTDLSLGGVGFTFCCNATAFIQQNVNYLNNVC